MRSLVRSALGVGALVVVPAVAFGQMGGGPPPPPQIVTTGEGEVRVTPDRATVFVGVQTRAQSANSAAADNARRLRAVLDTLRAMGLASEQLSTMNYNVTPEMQYDRTGQQPPRVIGYIVTNTVRAEVRRIDQVGGVIDAALAKGANAVNGIEFSSSTAEQARRTALANAVTRAKADAEAMARAAGGSLGQVLEITSNTPMYRPVFAGRAMADMAQAPAAPTPIEPGEQTLQANVTVRWQFIQGR